MQFPKKRGIIKGLKLLYYTLHQFMQKKFYAPVSYTFVGRSADGELKNINLLSVALYIILPLHICTLLRQ
jgi:hypothetical protein